MDLFSRDAWGKLNEIVYRSSGLLQLQHLANGSKRARAVRQYQFCAVRISLAHMYMLELGHRSPDAVKHCHQPCSLSLGVHKSPNG